MLNYTSPNLVPDPDDATIRREHLTTLLHELGDPNALWVDGTPMVDHYLESIQNAASILHTIPYSEETGIPPGGAQEMKYGDVIKAGTVGKNFLKPENKQLAITVGFRVLALLREPDLHGGAFKHLDGWIALWKD